MQQRAPRLPSAPRPLEEAGAFEGDAAERGGRRSSRPLRRVRRAPKPPPGALVVTRRHVGVPLHALVAVIDGRVGQVGARAAIQRSVDAPSFAPRRAPLLVLVPAMAAVALLAVAAIGFLARGGATAGARSVPVEPRTERAVHEGVVDPGYRDA
ncbi:MAG: hypothetical protein WKG00_13655 [Polyangiaceae bacterium]